MAGNSHALFNKSMIKRKLIFGVLVLHFLMILSINLNHLVDDWRTVYPREEGEFPSLYKRVLSSITTSDTYTMISTYTGTNSSYGFYAPSVGSEFMLSFKVIDEKGDIIGMKTGPDLIQDESKMRFDLCTMPVQDMLLDTGSIAASYTKIMMHQISDHVRKQFEGGDHVIANIYIYKYPTPEEYLQNKGPREVSEVAKYKFDQFN